MAHRLRVLFTSPLLRNPAAGGPFLRIENSIKALSEITDLYIYSRAPLTESTGLLFYRGWCKELYLAPSTRVNRYTRVYQRAADCLMRKIYKRNVFEDKNVEADYRGLLDVAANIQPDIIWLGYGNISYPLLRYVKEHSNFKVVLDTDSVWSRYLFRELPYARGEQERQRITRQGEEKADEERWGTQLADVTTAVSQVDADYYRRLAACPEKVHLFSNVVDVDTYQQVPPPAHDLRKPCLYLAGSFFGTQSPMEDGTRWLIKEVLPLVRQRIPTIRLYVIGRGSDSALSDIEDRDITVTGQLPSVLPYLCHCDVALVPLRFESGTRYKIIEAGACGVPVVSTTLGAEGLAVVNGRDALIADEPSSFADSIIRLLEDPDLASSLTRNLKSLVWEKHSVAALAEEGRLVLEYLTGRPLGTGG
jgi:glycosyltransferase involved in cell wall biosynthesis